MEKPVCVITGASGLIGSGLVNSLALDFDVHAVARRRPSSAGHASWHAIDLSKQGDLGSLPSRVDAVLYLAQSEYFRDFPQHGIEVHQVNTASMLRFLDYALKADCRNFVYASSGGVYGSGEVRMSEELQIPAHGNLGFYLSTKICSEILAHNYAAFMGVTILRYFFVYGPGQRSSMLIPRLVQRVRDGQPIVLQGQNGIRINPIHVVDAVAATKKALSLSGSHTINVGGPEVLSMRQIGLVIGEAVGRKPVFTSEPNGGPSHLSGDITKMKQLLGTPAIGFAEGVRSLL